MFIIQFIRGFCMALADSVPGVSGGTIAFLLGFYDKFIDSIDDLLTGTKEERKDAFVFLITYLLYKLPVYRIYYFCDSNRDKRGEKMSWNQ